MKHPRAKLIGVVLLIIIICASVFHTWVFSFAPVTAGDWHFHDEYSLREFLNPPNVINSGAFTGIDIIGLAFYPFNLLTALFSSWGFSYSAALRFVFLFPIVFIGPVSFYLLARKIFKSDLAGLIGALLYQFNPYFLILDNGVLTLMVSCALFPLIFLLYLTALEKQSLKWFLVVGLVMYVASFYEIRGVYLTAPLLVGFGIYYELFIRRTRQIRQFLISQLLYSVPYLVVFGLSLYWIFGLMANRNPDLNQAYFHRALFGEGIMSATASLAQFHPFWAGDHATNFVVMKVIPRFWLLPLGAILGFWVSKKNKIAVFFGVIAFLGVFLSKQSAEPFGNFYKWLFFNVPGFSAFRESSKFYFYTAIGFSMLNAGLITFLVRQKKLPLLILSVFVASYSILIWQNAKGQFTGSMRGLSVVRQMPEEYRDLKKFLSSQSEFSRSLWVPYYSRWIPNYPTSPKLAANSLYYSNWNQINPDLPITVKASEAERFIEMLSHPNSQRLLNISSIKYVIIPLNDNQNDDDFFYLFNKPWDYYATSSAKISYLKPIQFSSSGNSRVKLFTNETARPLLYLTDKPENISTDTNFQPVKFSRYSSYEYKVTLPEISKGEEPYLQFTTVYDPNWRVYTSRPSWPAIFNASIALDPAFNTKNVAGFNAFRLPDKFSHQTIYLYYLPQAYVYLGWLSSLIILFILLIYLFLPNRLIKSFKQKIQL